jgi:uroporphyrinogen decarboxylase
MDDPYRVSHIRQWAKQLRDENNYAIIGTPWLLFPLERAFAMQGMDTFLLNMSMNPDLASALLHKIYALCKTLMGHFLDETGDLIDMIKIGDDLGTQESLLMSPRMYRAVLKPIHKDYIAFIKSKTRAKVFFHTDGDVFNLMDDFIEIGVDILNPIQTAAGRMSNLEELKKRWGSQLTFCGAIDTQRILPFGTPAEVRDEVRRVIDILAPGGGYIITSVHTIMSEVPPENILAMVDAV